MLFRSLAPPSLSLSVVSSSDNDNDGGASVAARGGRATGGDDVDWEVSMLKIQRWEHSDQCRREAHAEQILSFLSGL